MQDNGAVFEAASLNLKPKTAQGRTITYHAGGEYLGIFLLSPSLFSVEKPQCLMFVENLTNQVISSLGSDHQGLDYLSGVNRRAYRATAGKHDGQRSIPVRYF